MCGFVGTLVFDGSAHRVSEAALSRMRDTMAHRGPDGAGNWISPDRRIGLAHRRLSIIDLSTAADQPMCNEDGSRWLAYNGEIYNHKSIRDELEAIGGHQWRTDHSDTEVIVHAFEQWGVDCLQRFRGMFAFAYWDGPSRELWLVRDRIGIKPLYYSIHNGRITFASEIKALLADPDQRRGVDEEALFHYLSFLTTPAPQTLYSGINKLPAGCWLRVRGDGQVTQHRYWDVWDHVQPMNGADHQDIANEVLGELRTAVQLRKVSDVPVGVFLSGGIDSSTNAALFSEGESAPIKTFSIGYDGEYESYQNELHFARQMANEVGADYHERLLSIDDLLDFLPEMVRLQDEPLADPVCVPVYYVSKLARDNGVKVCQVGEGADELFWGYGHWKRILRLQHLDDLPVPRTLKKLGLATMGLAQRDQSIHYEWLRRGAVRQPVFWGGAEAFTQRQKERLLSPRLRERFRSLTSWDAIQPIHQRFVDKASRPSHLDWMSYLDLNMRLPELLLMRVDKMSMGVSLETRVPFLDHKFVELAMSISEKVKTHRAVSKSILKRAVRGLIPDALIDRRKQGFSVPVYEWFFGRLGERIQRDLAEFCDQTDFLDYQEILRLIERRKGPQLWYLLNLSLWWKAFIA